MSTRPRIKPQHLPALTRMLETTPEMLPAMGLSVSLVRSEVDRARRSKELDKITSSEEFTQLVSDCV
jgi:hypothetical protein